MDDHRQTYSPPAVRHAIFLNNLLNKLRLKTSEQHTAADLVNLVYYPTGFV